MEKAQSTPERIETTETPNGKILPGGEGIKHPEFITFTKQDHPFLQKFIDAGLQVHIKHEELTIEGYNSAMLIQIYKDHVYLKCISTEEKYRRCGNGSKLMRQLIDIADETKIRLMTFILTPQVNEVHPVLVIGATGKKKVPVKQLKKWFSKFGFTDHSSFGPRYMDRNPHKKQTKTTNIKAISTNRLTIFIINEQNKDKSHLN